MYTRNSVRLPWLSGVFILWAVFSGLEARAQTGTVRGFVSDASDGQSMELVNVVLQTLEGDFVTGAVTSGEGVYVLERIRPGRYVLQASYIGYESSSDTLQVSGGEQKVHNIILTPDEAALGEVVVQDERLSGAANVTAGQQTIRPDDIELIPSPDLSPDLVGYLTAMPGIVSGGDRGGQLFIRGGEPSQNLILLDGIAMYQPFHMLGFYSSFPADVLQKADVYSGGFGAKYAGRLSSVIDIATRSGNLRRFTGAVSVSPFVSSVLLEGPLVPNRASLLLSGRRSFLKQGAERLTSAALPFEFGDALAKLHVEVTPASRLSVTAINTYDEGALAENEAGLPGDELRWSNRAIGGRYVALPPLTNFVGEIQLSYSQLRSEMGPADAPTRSSQVGEFRGSVGGTFYGGNWVDTEIGVAGEVFTLSNELGGLYQNTQIQDAAFYNIAVYGEPDIQPFPGLHIRPGIRFHFYRVDDQPHVEPRLRIVWEQGIHKVSAAAGLYHQEVVGLSDRRDATSVFTAWTYIPGVGAREDDARTGQLGRAIHALLGYQISPLPGLDWSLEGYHKALSNLFVAEWTSYPRLTTRLQPATGRTYGFDTRVAYRGERFYGHINYGYSNTRYEAEQASLRLWYGTETLEYRPAHDRRHQLNTVLSTTLLGFDMSAQWQYGSGLPFSQAIGFDGFILMNGPGVDLSQQGSRRVIYESPFNAVLPAFHRLDVSVERTFDLPGAALTLQASAINVYDRRNVFHLDVFTLQRTDQLPFIPSFGIKVAVE